MNISRRRATGLSTKLFSLTVRSPLKRQDSLRSKIYLPKTSIEAYVREWDVRLRDRIEVDEELLRVLWEVREEGTLEEYKMLLRSGDELESKLDARHEVN